ncbi:hypothetical protein BDW22DRAFT_1417728 [Trametopsis cervina]|nr:hypothetical protein BDW22DRAFT_1417728 [Trametopsis cervina]
MSVADFICLYKRCVTAQLRRTVHVSFIVSPAKSLTSTQPTAGMESHSTPNNHTDIITMQVRGYNFETLRSSSQGARGHIYSGERSNCWAHPPVDMSPYIPATSEQKHRSDNSMRAMAAEMPVEQGGVYTLLIPGVDAIDPGLHEEEAIGTGEECSWRVIKEGVEAVAVAAGEEPLHRRA